VRDIKKRLVKKGYQPRIAESLVREIQGTLMCSRLLISESRFDSVFECFSTGFSEEFAA
jgi:hypothetical protein